MKNYDTFARNPRTALMTKNVDRFSEDDVALIKHQATQLLGRLNSL